MSRLSEDDQLVGPGGTLTSARVARSWKGRGPASRLLCDAQDSLSRLDVRSAPGQNPFHSAVAYREASG
jgi:hypothetical protein